MLGNEYYRKRQFTQAIDSYKQALALKSDYDLVVINMANAYRQLGKDEEALVGYRRFMELDPRNAQIRYEAAQILVDRGKLAEARAQLRGGAQTAAVDGRGAQRARHHRAQERRRRAGGTRDSIGDRSEGRRPARPLQSGAARRATRRLERRGRRVQARDRALSRPATRPNSIWDGSTNRLATSRRSSRPTRRRSRSIRTSPKGTCFWRSCIST